MDGLLAFLTVAGLIAAAVGVIKLQERAQRENAAVRAAGRRQHLRGGQYASTCTWCKSTALASKLMVFQRARTGGTWEAWDVSDELRACPDQQVEVVASVFKLDDQRWRRFCTEKCAREFFASADVGTLESFIPCQHCSTRSPASLVRCPNCGAPRAAA